jgi:hypothetical protein
MSDLPAGARPLSRRDALKAVAALAGTALVPAALLPGALGGCAPRGDGGVDAVQPVSQQDAQDLLEAIADTLLPDTAASPGARAAGVGATMALLLADCRTPQVQQRITEGLQALRAASQQRGSDFASLSQPERERLLREADSAATRVDGAHWFEDVRELALVSYFSSETGMTRATRYERIPGRYQGCLPLQPGQPAWA